MNRPGLDFTAHTVAPFAEAPWMRGNTQKMFYQNLERILRGIYEGKKLTKLRTKYCKKMNWDTFRAFIKRDVLCHP